MHHFTSCNMTFGGSQVLIYVAQVCLYFCIYLYYMSNTVAKQYVDSIIHIDMELACKFGKHKVVKCMTLPDYVKFTFVTRNRQMVPTA